MNENLGHTNMRLSHAQQQLAHQLQTTLRQVRQSGQSIAYEGEHFVLTYNEGERFVTLQSSHRCIPGHFWDAGIIVVLKYLGETFTEKEESCQCPVFLKLQCSLRIFFVTVEQ